MYALLTLFAQIDGQVYSADVTQSTIHDVLESWLRSCYNTPVEYKVDWVDVNVKGLETDDCRLLSAEYIPSRLELEQCFTTGPFMGKWVRLEEGATLQVKETPLINPFEIAIKAVLDCWNNDQPKTPEGEGVYWDYKDALAVQIELLHRPPTFESTLKLCFEIARHRVNKSLSFNK